MAEATRTSLGNERKSTILILSDDSRNVPRIWPGRWLQHRDDCREVDMGDWNEPHRNTWVNKLNLAIHQAGAPVILVTHGLGCVAAAWWAEYEQAEFADPVVGALLVAPPDVERPGLDPRLARFGACPRSSLPFASFLIASRNDPHCSFGAAVSLSRDWGARFAYAGDVLHADRSAASGEWPLGERLLERLIVEAHGPQAWPRPAWPATGRRAATAATVVSQRQTSWQDRSSPAQEVVR